MISRRTSIDGAVLQLEAEPTIAFDDRVVDDLGVREVGRGTARWPIIGRPGPRSGS